MLKYLMNLDRSYYYFFGWAALLGLIAPFIVLIVAINGG
ncbi:hypothetical protein VMF7928_01268 [Vibrio marisflavi CECT 7928]|uniref:Uncharacterized protein n=1 Tax=Vibrio marisflavi CECT 7928 TaxID=634439 RepID=A0ABM9A1T8_9VIBR|nr:hypothetical protein VMF7928_01268 [Vibrio marisflavi CECT 7928]